MGMQENKQAAQDAYAAFSSGDAEGAMRNIDDSIEWTVRGDNALTGTYNGKQAVGELWGKFMSKDFRTEPHDYIAEGDKVVGHWTMEATNSGPMMGMPASGKPVKMDGIDITRWQNGKLVEMWHIEDIMAMMQQIGAVPSQ